MPGPERRFQGLPDRVRCLPVPLPLLGSLLAEIDDLAEVKVTLGLWRLLNEQPAGRQIARRSELLRNHALLRSVRSVDRSHPERALERGLRGAVRRGTLLSVRDPSSAEADELYLFNTPRNRLLAKKLRNEAGDLLPKAAVQDNGAQPTARPNIFELYEENIGLLTPLVVEELREAERKYPEAWLEEAFREAVSYNKRNWRYVQRVLQNWATNGRGESGETRRRAEPPEDSRRYLQGRYGYLIKH